MHYITGTSFVIAPNAKSNLSPDRRFKVGLTYTLLRISRKEDKFVYTFACVNDRTKLEIEFNSCNEADNLIAKIKKEILPNYYKEEPILED